MKISVNKPPSQGRFYGSESMQCRSVKVVTLGGWNRIKERMVII